MRHLNFQHFLPDKIRVGTQKLRATLIFTAMYVLTPNLRKEIIDWKTCIDRTPRPFTLYLKQHFGDKPLVGAEIGFGFGFNALNLLEELNVERLYCIDPLKPYVTKFGQYEGKYLNKATSLFPILSKDSRLCFVKLESDEAFDSNEIPHDLDFVYVDGLHTTEQVYKDLLNSFNHVKVGGVVGGHDFTRDFQDSVLPAVFKVSAETGLIPTIEMPDFWFVKTGDCCLEQVPRKNFSQAGGRGLNRI